MVYERRDDRFWEASDAADRGAHGGVAPIAAAAVLDRSAVQVVEGAIGADRSRASWPASSARR